MIWVVATACQATLGILNIVLVGRLNADSTPELDTGHLSHVEAQCQNTRGLPI